MKYLKHDHTKKSGIKGRQCIFSHMFRTTRNMWGIFLLKLKFVFADKMRS